LVHRARVRRMIIDVLLVTTERRTGAFITTLDLVGHLRARGHTVTVNDPSVHPDVTITQLGDHRAERIRGAHFLMVHGANVRLRRRLPKHTVAWFPSDALRQWYGPRGRTVVAPPAIDPGQYEVPRGAGRFVTLSQTSPSKGASHL